VLVLQQLPSKTFRPLRPLFKYIQTYLPDVYWALTSYRKVEKKPPQPGDRREIRDAVINSPDVQNAINVSSEINGVPVEHSAKKAEKIFELMAADMWIPAVRFMAYLMRKVCHCQLLSSLMHAPL